jgi:hypothetical protein
MGPQYVICFITAWLRQKIGGCYYIFRNFYIRFLSYILRRLVFVIRTSHLLCEVEPYTGTSCNML